MYSDGGEQYARTGEVVLVIKTLPDGVPPANTVRIDGDLYSPLVIVSSKIADGTTSESNQNFLGNCIKIFVYVPYILRMKRQSKRDKNPLPWSYSELLPSSKQGA